MQIVPKHVQLKEPIIGWPYYRYVLNFDKWNLESYLHHFHYLDIPRSERWTADLEYIRLGDRVEERQRNILEKYISNVELYEWLMYENIRELRFSQNMSLIIVEIVFKEQDTAMKFKLTWL